MEPLLKNKYKIFSHKKYKKIKYKISKNKIIFSKKTSILKKNISFLFLLFSLFIIILFIFIFIFRKNIYNNTTKEINEKEKNKLIKEIKGQIEPPWFKEKLIMHSLGAYNNTDYVDSLEPLKYWYFEKKMHLMEADFHLTKDHHTILAHDFDNLNFTPTLEEFKKLPGKGNTTRMTFEDLVLFMEKNKDLYIMTDTKYNDIKRIEIEFDEMTSILSNHKELYERFIIEIYNEKMYLFLKNKYPLFKYYIFTMYQRWTSPKELEDFRSIAEFCKINKINAILMIYFLFSQSTLLISRNYSIPIYLHTVNNIRRAIDYMKKGVKGIITDNITDELLEKYIIDNDIKLNQTNI